MNKSNAGGHTFRYIAPVRAKMPLNLSPIPRILVDSAAFWHVREQYTGMCDPGIKHHGGSQGCQVGVFYANCLKFGIL